MKKKVALISITVVLILVCGFTVWQWANMRSVITAIKYSEEELSGKIDAAKTETKQQVDEYTNGYIRDFTLEEEELIRQGKITPEQAIELVNEKRTEQQIDIPIVDEKEIIKQSVEKMYALKATYMGKLGAIERQAKADYARNKAEKKGAAELKRLITLYLGKVTALESECDAAVSEVIQALEAKLREIGADTKIISVMKNAYEEEKVLKKSYFISKYK
ncbi:MAG: hypothetical protein GX800_00245 [Clostridiaceae bacterium]|nr:hypothetical protein [Clostridiaceae bacterium]